MLSEEATLYWSAVCRVHLWTPHVEEHLKDTLEQEGYRYAFVCSQVCADPWTTSVCNDVWLSVYVCLWGVWLNVLIWCWYKTYVGEKDVCSEKGNSRAFNMDFTVSWSVCICANRYVCMCACVHACIFSKYPAQCWTYSVSSTLTMLTLLEHVTFFECTFLRDFFPSSPTLAIYEYLIFWTVCIQLNKNVIS